MITMFTYNLGLNERSQLLMYFKLTTDDTHSFYFQQINN